MLHHAATVGSNAVGSGAWPNGALPATVCTVRAVQVRSSKSDPGCRSGSSDLTSLRSIYRFWAGSQSVAVFVRMLRNVTHSNMGKYVIASTIQPQSNVNDAPLELNITITLNGTKVRLTTRRQGSVHLLTNASHRPVIRQLDSHHEATHFLRWSSDFKLEAELHDEHAIIAPREPGLGLEPSTELAPDAAHSHDFAGSTTFVTLCAGQQQQLKFSLTPRPLHLASGGRTCTASTRVYNVTIRARAVGASSLIVRAESSDGQSNGHTHISIPVAGPVFSDRVMVGTGKPGRTYDHGNGLLTLPTDKASTVILTVVGDAVDVDSLVLKEVQRADCA